MPEPTYRRAEIVRKLGRARSGILFQLIGALGALAVLFGCSSDASRQPTSHLAAGPIRPSYPVPFATAGDELGVWDGQHYRPIFLKGINLGVAVPGTQPGELAATTEQYDRWLALLGEMGGNAIRIYTLHYPRFFDSVAKYNEAHPAAPIYILHGAWLDENNPTHDFFDMTDAFDSGIREVIDAAHGNLVIAERRGRAFGTYNTDISPWIIGWIIGREISPDEIASSNAAHPGITQYRGATLNLPSGTPMEVWMAERLDRLISYERGTYGSERPVSVSSWPTLDPMHHPSEDLRSVEDLQQLDLENIDTFDAPAGYFASFHAYPYYPDFMTEDLQYQKAADSLGPNSYFGYLLDLKKHYAKHPVLIAETGVPSSWGNAHFGPDGMDHGGEDETEQGNTAARLALDALESKSAGVMLFAWIDEWWKRTWIVDELNFPRSRYKLWHNVASPEENFGLIAFDVGPPDYSKSAAVTGNGRVQRVEAAADAEFFHVRLELRSPLAAGETLTLGYDTYGDAIGESVLPGGIHTTRRCEFALTLTAPDSAQLYVTEAYDLFGIWHRTSTDAQLYHSIATDGAPWNTVRWQNNGVHTTGYGLDVPPTIFDAGKLRVRIATLPSSRDAVMIDGAQVEIRLPWTYLQITDPSTRSVMNDDRTMPITPVIDGVSHQTATTDGIALTVAIGADVVETGRFGWDGWEVPPPTTERKKASMDLFGAAMRSLP